MLPRRSRRITRCTSSSAGSSRQSSATTSQHTTRWPQRRASSREARLCSPKGGRKRRGAPGGGRASLHQRVCAPPQLPLVRPEGGGGAGGGGAPLVPRGGPPPPVAPLDAPEGGVVPRVVGHGVAGRDGAGHDPGVARGALAHQEEGAARAVALQDVEHARRRHGVGTVVEGEGDGRLGGGHPDQAAQRQRGPGDQILQPLLGARYAGGELRLVRERRRSGVILAHGGHVRAYQKNLCRVAHYRLQRKNKPPTLLSFVQGSSSYPR